MKFRLAALCLVASLFAGPALAQATAASGATPVPAQAKPADYSARLALAQKIEGVAPSGQQIDDAIAAIAQRVPAQSRADFQAKLEAVIDKRKLQAVSIDAMAQTYTAAELTRMYDYMSSPEAKSIAAKTPIYEQLVKPEIVRELDKALMDAKLSGNPNSPFAAPASNSAQPAAPGGWKAAVTPAAH